MSLKSVLKKKFKIKNPIVAMKKKKNASKHVLYTPSADTYIQIDTDNISKERSITEKEQNQNTAPENLVNGENVDEKNMNIDGLSKSITETKRNKKKRKSTDNDANLECEVPTKKRVTFAADVKSEKDDQKGNSSNLKLISLNKRKKLNYIKKLKAKKNKQKNAKKCEENTTAVSTPRQERALEYLMQWKNDRTNWKFKKIYQSWLIYFTYDPLKVPKEHFGTLVEYLQTVEGQIRSIILQNANKVVSEFSSSNVSQQELNSSQEVKYQRARTIIQMFD
ncbi:uncharacterized protein C7orf50 homolog [Acyrthosiphon pisum]|uniref:WKF domain-containing protein n=1 Tax=Acyrthosiphon pisum TaxID=7029 RepID=A0A8R2B1B7_ACYPI|nr:uncharacterized protein C7orf50 homolog [Acyrthosiphon pisum]|eukprot:XP_008178679.1 PREDICTED: uncharacterized protein C7orf50 homolog [Acyrthosiphon pisum]